jgi:hypothetical protein
MLLAGMSVRLWVSLAPDDERVDLVGVDLLDGRAFARLFDVRGAQLGWFLGAGASAASNIATGYDMIVDFKARMFSEAIGVSRREIDPGDPLWAARIESYFDGHPVQPGRCVSGAALFGASYPVAAWIGPSRHAD